MLLSRREGYTGLSKPQGVTEFAFRVGMTRRGTMTAEQDRRLEFYGGLVGSFVPLGFFAVSVVLLTWTGSITIRALFGPLVLVVGLIVFLAKDKTAACEALWTGVADKTLAVIIFAFLGAGVLGQVVGVSGATRAVVWLAHQAGVGETLFVVFTFVAAGLIATATGTATGTCITSVPVLYPAAVVLGAHPALVLGAIYSGARLGDNLAPISDTTIASAFHPGSHGGGGRAKPPEIRGSGRRSVRGALRPCWPVLETRRLFV